MEFLLEETMNPLFILHTGKYFSEVVCSRQKYRNHIIYFYSVKHFTVNNTKCAMPSLSCLLSFYTIPISPIYSFFISYSPFFFYACMHNINLESKGPRSLNFVTLDNKGEVSIWTVIHNIRLDVVH